MHKENDFDLVDDLVHFINNNSEFYKEIYLPVVNKFATVHKSHMSPKVSVFAPVVRQAYEYYKQFVEHNNPEVNLPEQLRQEDFIKTCNSLYQQQKDYIEKGSHQQDSVSEEIKHISKLAGIGNGSNTYKTLSMEDINQQSADKVTFMKEHNIQSGTREWMDLWFPLDTTRFPAGFRGRK
jgi:hypothetical protein